MSDILRSLVQGSEVLLNEDYSVLVLTLEGGKQAVLYLPNPLTMRDRDRLHMIIDMQLSAYEMTGTLPKADV